MRTKMMRTGAGKQVVYWVMLFLLPQIASAQIPIHELGATQTEAYAAEVHQLMNSDYPYMFLQDGQSYGTTDGVAHMVCVEANQQIQLEGLPIDYSAVRMLQLRIEEDDDMAVVHFLPATLFLFPQLEYLVFTSRQAIGAAQVAQMTSALPEESDLTILYKLLVDN